MDATTRRYKLCEDAVRDANEETKRKHKVNYDANHYDVEFEIGSKVNEIVNSGTGRQPGEAALRLPCEGELSRF